MEETDLLTIKLYSPLTADFFPDEEEEYDWYEGGEMDRLPLGGEDLQDYQASIQKMVDKENHFKDWHGNLMEYFDEQRSPSLKEKAVCALVSVEVHNGKLCGCTTVTVKESLTELELSALKKYMTGQFSDGWGEGFEQRDIEVSGGVLNVHFWQTKKFSFETEICPTAPDARTDMRPEMKLIGQDGNIFSILGRASQLLKKNGQSQQAKEMCDRVCACPNYQKALLIVSEYVKTELSDPPQHEPKKKDRGDAR